MRFRRRSWGSCATSSCVWLGTLTHGLAALFSQIGRHNPLTGLQRNGHEGLIKACVIRHDGKVFSSGHDLKELHLMQSTQGTTQEVFSVCGEMMMGVREAEFPVIAVVNGLATAGGCQLVAMCDVAIASENSTFATPGVHLRLSLHPTLGESRVPLRLTNLFVVLSPAG
jgi:enoyl-CoA hydratase/carnithine racemase